MSTKTLLTGVIAAFFMSIGFAGAEVQNSAYTYIAGVNNYFDRGGYSSVRHMQNGEIYSETVNDASDRFDAEYKAKKEAINEAEKNVSNTVNDEFGGIKDSTLNRKYDYNPYTGADSGVNKTKCIYTDELGRLHFFGRKNVVRE